jgi:predicted transcriptional regulator
MGNLVSSIDDRLFRIGIYGGIVGGFFWTAYMATISTVQPTVVRKSGTNDSFVSFDDDNELDLEIQRTELHIQSIKEMMDRGDHRHQLEETLSRAEFNFQALFELKTKVEQHEINGLLLDSKITTEVARSVANREIGQQILFAKLN